MMFTPQSGSMGMDIPDGNAVRDFLEALFGDYEWEEGECIALRGLNEKGTDAKHFQEKQWAYPGEETVDQIVHHAKRWGDWRHGAFLTPAVMRNDQGQKDEDVACFTALCLDLDQPEIADATLDMLRMSVGPPTVVVESSEGKRHVYWKFSEPQHDTKRVAELRKTLALKSGGDASFGRISQVIRIPGSFHCKNGGHRMVELLECDAEIVHHFEDLSEAIENMAPLPSAKPEAKQELERMGAGQRLPGMGFLPSDSALGQSAGTFEAMLETHAYEGGGIPTRFDALTVVMGGYIRQARAGEISIADAKGLADEWMQTHMHPPFEHDRFCREWDGLLKYDVQRNGAIEQRAPEPPAHAVREDAEEGTNPDLIWAVHRWAKGATPVRKWVAQGLVKCGASHVLAADGGIGKTYALLDLALKIAAPRPGDAWMGQAMVPEHTGRVAVILTTEDDRDELHIRLDRLDPDGSRRAQAGDKLFVVPVLNTSGGGFTLASGKDGQASKRWKQTLAWLHRLSQSAPIGLVAVDTLAATLHGEENHSIVLQQYVTMLNMVQGVTPGAATMVTHHVRKPGNSKDSAGVIKGLDDMRAAIRGSGALLGGVRMAIGIWKDTKNQGRQFFRMGVVKGNNDEVMEGERLLARAPHGGLEAVDPAALGTDWERRQWLLAAIVRAADEGHPFSQQDKNTGLYARKGALHPSIRNIGRDGLVSLAEAMLDDGQLVRVKIGQGFRLDKPNGTLTNRTVLGWQMIDDLPNLEWHGWGYNATTGQVFDSNA